MSKQTMWLITMLSLMIVLSAYYIVNGPVETADDVATTEETLTETQETNPLELTLFGSEEEEPVSEDENEEEGQTSSDESDTSDNQEATEEDAPTFANKDFFVNMQTERYSINEQLLSKYENIMTDPNSSEEQTEAASAQLEELRSSIERITLMEELIRGQGYDDALVRQDEDRYDITVQAEEMSKKEVVQIIQLVQNEMEIPAAYLTVSYHP